MFLTCDVDFKEQDYQLIPFGAGRRGCPRLEFVVALIKLTLASLLHDFDWELPNGTKGEEVDTSNVGREEIKETLEDSTEIGRQRSEK